MTASPNPVASADYVTYTVTASNVGTATADNVVIQDTIPNDITLYANSAIGGTATFNISSGNSAGPGHTLTWPTLTLAVGQTQTVSISGTVAGGTANGTVIENVAVATYPGGLSSQATSPTVGVVVSSAAGLVVAIASDHDPVKPGDQVAYTVTFGNASSQFLPSSGAGVLTATVPTGTTFVSASAGGTAATGTIQWNIGSVAARSGQKVTFALSVGGTVAAGTVLQSQAQILDGTTVVTQASTANEVVQSAPLLLTTTVTPSPVAPGDLVTYTTKISNTGASTLTNVILTEAVPDYTTIYGTSAIGGPVTFSTPEGNSATVGFTATWPNWTLAAGQTRTVCITAGVSTNPVTGMIIHHYAAATHPGGETSESVDEVANSAPGLVMGIAADHSPAKPGDDVVYTVTLGNTATSVLPTSGQGVLTATLPAGATFVSATGGGAASGGTVQWSVGTVAAGAGQQVAFTVAVGGTTTAGSVLQSRLEMTDGLTGLIVADAAEATEVVASPVLTLTTTASPNPVGPNNSVTYTMTVTNTGGTTLMNVVLTEEVPDYTEVNGSSAIGGPVTFTTPEGNSAGVGYTVTWPAVTLTAGQMQTMTIDAAVAQGTPSGSFIHHYAVAAAPTATSELTVDTIVN